MYAIVDIETTGGYAAGNDITEVAIILHDGEHVTDRFETLIRPSVAIPRFIQALTGITADMVEHAPSFNEVAGEIYSRLQGRVFIAHNVNFDYSFLKYHLLKSGFDLTVPKLCTVRLARKVFPDLPSYSLGNLCRHFNVPITNRHRAGGDATATTTLFNLMLSHGGNDHIRQFLKKNSREQCLPPNLAKEQIENLPYSPGVYYFHDGKGKVIYVGKANNIRYRVSSHFTHNGPGRQRQEFLRNIHSISCQPCGTELMAFILENIEIRKYWPRYNSSQKRFTPVYGLYRYEDQNGYIRLLIEKKKANLAAFYTFNLLAEGQKILQELIREFSLCPKLCFIQIGDDKCVVTQPGSCRGACEQLEPADHYNQRVLEAIESLEKRLPTFTVVDESYDGKSQTCILIEKGRFYGMGYVPEDAAVYETADLKAYLKTYPETDYIRGLVYQYVQKFPAKKRLFATYTDDLQ